MLYYDKIMIHMTYFCTNNTVNKMENKKIHIDQLILIYAYTITEINNRNFSDDLAVGTLKLLF